ncbi:MAG: xanthine dehydrogenase family protein molybdopterin-binding subunit [Erythrobacter sp.]|jgi:xanthine dehydrogenase YagR molybdenum-binding subunit|uniref:xanthine dehydrogenase family protein molybdopterin-binding subunit n=1 Tax=Qipengyuania citrea TaxID=225971 RepID=UPI0020A06376|nr:xanthine dehydrogenase family protein molybdopterin-binding subunit [Qipengyuania citrea]MCP2017394.1 xanthine dehydrogenase YagR molybdenum-binding subunit [Qipengyuania citrea]MDE0901496.1 xanthine dehydrogenase family protein molybdopterin-binding subunit [Erythrobacter sp.]
MSAHLKQDEPDTANRLDSMKQGVIGKPLSRVEGLAKVTGTAPYAAEYPVDGCAEGVLVTATITRGEIVRIDKDSVLDRPGVIAVIDDERLTTRAAQGTANEAPQQSPQTVCYWGQPIALVVAETFEQARDAAKHLVVEYREEPGAPLFPAEVEAEEQEDETVRQGDLAQAMSAAAHSVDVTYTTKGHASAAMEPHAAIAEWDGEKLTVHASLQMLNYNITELADSLGLEEDKVRLVSRFVGGGFGSKLGVSEETVAASLAAIELQRPVRVVMSRQQVFQCIMRRSETTQRLRLAADTEGRLTGFGHEALVSNLPGETFAEPVLQSSHFLYGADNRELMLNVARIHLMTAGSVRAPGEAVGMPALEGAMDVLAEEVGIDPVELRLRNIPEDDPEEGLPFSSHKLAECLRQGADAFGWDAGPRKPRMTREGEWWVGTGMASAARVHNVGEAKARVTLKPDGTALVETDMTDIGTGTYTILAQIAGEMLGLDTADVLVDLGDTRHPRGPGSGGSWGASSSGSAVYVACKALREELASRVGVAETELDLANGQVVGGQTLVQLLGGADLAQEGHYEPGAIEDDFTAAGFGAFFAQVRVNHYTGETRVDRMLGAFGFGRVLNRKTARSQCLGGITWSIGAALTEALEFDPRDGHLGNCDLAEYHVPVHRDVPDLEVIMVEERDPAASPIQAKGIGELGMCGGAAAIANAIYHASGARLFDYPMTPDRVLACMPD